MKIRILSFMMALAMIFSVLLTGCGKEETYAYEEYDSFGTINGENIDYRFVYFAARCEQASIESYYYESLGPDMWEEVNNGKTLEERVKGTIVEDLQNMLILKKYAAEKGITLTEAEQERIVKAAEDFMKNNSEEAIAKMGATQEIVEQYLALYTISNKAHDEIVSVADTDFALEEYKRTTISYLVFEESKYLYDDVMKILEECKTDYDTLTGKDGKYKATKVTYGSEGTLDKYITKEILAELDELVSGEVYPTPFRSNGNYIIVKMIEEFDTEASTAAKESLIAEAEEKVYNAVMEEFKKGITFEINEEAWEALKFDIHFSIKQ